MSDSCPCGSGESYAACCGRLHRGEGRAATAEQLMRSRYSAFAVGDRDYLLRTWFPATAPAALDLDDDLRWVRLDVTDVARGGFLDTDGEVEFTAHYRSGTVRSTQHERSAFVREGGRWLYVGEAR